tara:strand:+ start:2929 stop:3150 length:222 start_codon:yes stop_codon:yes gene_type:complete
MSKSLKVGDTVNWRGTWGKDASQDAVVNAIECNCNLGNGVDVIAIDWANVNDRGVVVDLDNGCWAYGNQITPK